LELEGAYPLVWMMDDDERDGCCASARGLRAFAWGSHERSR
jgi:hypothetical protein